MAGRRNLPPADKSLCRRCQSPDTAITVRTEPLCKACFDKYVQTKVVKRMETFRVKNSEPGKEKTLLLPLSFGPCSTALLYTLSRHLKNQIDKSGRPGFKLHVLHIEQPDEPPAQPLLDQLQSRFPEHTYAAVPLASITSLPHLLPSTLQPSSSLASLLSILPTPTARADLSAHLLRKLIAHHARETHSAAILLGDSTTRLAERALAETAKGRGFAVPWLVSDGPISSAPTPSEAGDGQGEIPTYHPLRDLLSKELVPFVAFADPPLTPFLRTDSESQAAPAAMKNSTIDALTRGYFAGVEEEYPSIVANVVRTTSKLRARDVGPAELGCELCDVPLEGAAPERSRLCWGCVRTMQGVGAAS